jgi:hypothetical protein
MYKDIIKIIKNHNLSNEDYVLVNTCYNDFILLKNFKKIIFIKNENKDFTKLKEKLITMDNLIYKNDKIYKGNNYSWINYELNETIMKKIVDCNKHVIFILSHPLNQLFFNILTQENVDFVIITKKNDDISIYDKYDYIKYYLTDCNLLYFYKNIKLRNIFGIYNSKHKNELMKLFSRMIGKFNYTELINIIKNNNDEFIFDYLQKKVIVPKYTYTTESNFKRGNSRWNLIKYYINSFNKKPTIFS